MIISKGQGNFETLVDRSDRPLFFLFLVKCPVVATTLKIAEVDQAAIGSGGGLSVILRPGDAATDPHRQFGCAALLYSGEWYLTVFDCEGGSYCSPRTSEATAPFVELDRLYVLQMTVEPRWIVSCSLSSTAGERAQTTLDVDAFVGGSSPQGVALSTFGGETRFIEPMFCGLPAS